MQPFFLKHASFEEPFKVIGTAISACAETLEDAIGTAISACEKGPLKVTIGTPISECEEALANTVDATSSEWERETLEIPCCHCHRCAVSFNAAISA
eukprot:670467-Karenia_brevis.AAC.1